jgi:hypothetical protein
VVDDVAAAAREAFEAGYEPLAGSGGAVTNTVRDNSDRNPPALRCR